MAVLGILMVLPYCPYVENRGMPYRRYASNPTFNQHNKFSLFGTLEPQVKNVHREEKGHRPENQERAPTQGTALRLSGTPLAVTGGLSAAWFTAEPLIEVTSSWVVCL